MPNVVSIYSGAGGIDCGFAAAGFDICFSTDFWKPACDTLEKNGTSRLVECADIRSVNYERSLSKIGLTVDDVDVLAGGPPCPAYSKSRFYRKEKKRALEDENSFTLYEYFRALDELRPKVFFFENVFGFVYKPHQAAFELLKEHRKWQRKQRIAMGDRWVDSDRIFAQDDGTPVHPDSITGWFHDFISRTDLPQISIHSLRHTNITLLLAAGIPLKTVSYRAGHAQTSTTANIYSHAIRTADEKAAEVLEGVIR